MCMTVCACERTCVYVVLYAHVYATSAARVGMFDRWERRGDRERGGVFVFTLRVWWGRESGDDWVFPCGRFRGGFTRERSLEPFFFSRERERWACLPALSSLGYIRRESEARRNGSPPVLFPLSRSGGRERWNRVVFSTTRVISERNSALLRNGNIDPAARTTLSSSVTQLVNNNNNNSCEAAAALLLLEWCIVVYISVHRGLGESALVTRYF